MDGRWAPDPASAPLGVGAPLRPPSRGWFSDPSAPRERRYFDGVAWTEHRHSHREVISQRMLLISAGALLSLSVIAFVAGMVVSGMDTRPVSEFESQLARLLLFTGLIAFPLACITGVIAAIWAWVLNIPPRGSGGGM